MQTTTAAKPGLVITAPGSLLQYCAQMDKIAAVIKAQAQQFDRAAQYLAHAYENSALGKKRTAKSNLTAAQIALDSRNATLHQVAARFTDQNTAPTVSELHALVHDPHQANAPNRCNTKMICKSAPTITNNKGRPTTQD